jgi:hypothetical protein
MDADGLAFAQGMKWAGKRDHEENGGTDGNLSAKGQTKRIVSAGGKE